MGPRMGAYTHARMHTCTDGGTYSFPNNECMFARMGKFRLIRCLRTTQIPLLQRALPTEKKIESGTSQSKSGTSINLSNSGILISTMEKKSRLICEAHSVDGRMT